MFDVLSLYGSSVCRFALIEFETNKDAQQAKLYLEVNPTLRVKWRGLDDKAKQSKASVEVTTKKAAKVTKRKSAVIRSDDPEGPPPKQTKVTDKSKKKPESSVQKDKNNQSKKLLKKLKNSQKKHSNVEKAVSEDVASAEEMIPPANTHW